MIHYQRFIPAVIQALQCETTWNSPTQLLSTEDANAILEKAFAENPLDQKTVDKLLYEISGIKNPYYEQNEYGN